ncbi:outer membrane protein, multidrug efflux system [Rhizobium sp. RU20A]|uniref:efflux transporter outer membrane subunit n=1 Tax=Rhizobium sp. RU20A TaxID=1907412 RepID=UPI000954FCA1|nr:efflux transporter outer membrane subunit [Rhizobium sp. RU20A]SIR32118.1 outer membrane protein, multidrug efflux system [Rhizobium sp. RU20A]
MMKPVLCLLTVALLSGCSFGPRVPERQAAPLPPAYSETAGAIPGKGATDGETWWRGLGDPLLDRLIADTALGNLDIAQAEARIRASDAGITAAGADGLPSLTLGASHVTERQNGSMRTVDGTVTRTGGSLSAAWLLDLFGEVRSQVGSARATREAAVAGAAVARLAVISDMASAYVDARYYQSLKRLSEARLASMRRTEALTRARLHEGLASDLDLSRAEEASEAIAADIPLYDASFRRSAHRVATLMGRPAADLVPMLETASAQPAPAFSADTGVPADLLRNRPDIRRAEMDFEAAVSDIGYAWSQLFPSITLSGSVTPTYVNTSAKNGSLTTWSFGPQLRLPIFDGGRLRANVKIAKAKAEEKEAAWRAAILKAVEDVENALVSYNRQKQTLASSNTRVERARKSLALARATEREGLSSLFETLDADRKLKEAEANLALARRNLALQYVALNIAVGRGLPGPGVAASARGEPAAGPVTGAIDAKTTGATKTALVKG